MATPQTNTDPQTPTQTPQVSTPQVPVSAALPSAADVNSFGGTMGVVPQESTSSPNLPTASDVAAVGGTTGEVPTQTPDEAATIRHLRSRGITNPTPEQIQEASEAQHLGAANPNLDQTHGPIGGLLGLDGYQEFKKRLFEPVTEQEIEQLPGLQPDQVQILRSQGLDTLATLPVGYKHGQVVNLYQELGPQKFAYLEDHILHGFTPEVVARGAAKSISDWYSPVQLAMSVPGRLAHGYAAAAEAAEAAGLTQKASELANKARLTGVIGTLSGVPFIAKQINALTDNWQRMSPAERVAALSGILGGATMAGISAHQGGAAAVKPAVNAITEKAADIAHQAAATVGVGREFDDLLKSISPPTKTKAADYAKVRLAAKPQLVQIMRDNPNVSTPQDLVDAIQNHIDEQETALRNRARAMQTESGPAEKSLLTGVGDDFEKALDQHFKELQGAFSPAQIEAAKTEVLNRLRQGEGPEPRDPSLFEAENLRRQLNDETKPVFGTENASSALKEAKVVAAQVLRDHIDDKYEELGVPGVKEWRQQESPLITVKDQLTKAFEKAEQMGKFNVVKAAASNAGWGMLGALLGHGVPGALGLELMGVGKDYLKDRLTNPNRLTEQLVNKAQTEEAPKAVVPTKKVTEVPSTVSKAAVAEEAPETQKTVESAGGVFRGVHDNGKSGLVEITLPRSMTDQLEGLPDRFKDFVSVTLPTEGLTPEAVKDAMDHKFQEMGGKANPKSGEVAETPKENGQLLERLPKNKNASGTVRDDIHHEMGHAVVANELGVKTVDGIRSDRHPDSGGAVAQTKIDWGGLPSLGNAEEFLPHLSKVLTVLMGGGAGEEITGGPTMDENTGMANDEVDAIGVLNALGYSGDEAANLMGIARTRAQKILERLGAADTMKKYSETREPNLPETHHMSQERLQEMLEEIKNGPNQTDSNTARSGGKTEGGDQANVAGGKGKGAENAGGKAEEVPELVAKKSFAEVKPSKIAEGGKDFYEQKFPKSYEVEVTWPDGDKHIDEVKGLNEGHALSRAKGNWPDASDIKVLRETTREKGATKTKLLPLVAGQALATGLALLAGHDWKKTENKQTPAPAPAAQPQPATPVKVDIPSTLKDASSDFGIPLPLLKRQAMQESHLDPNAVSRKGAIGVMQLMPRTAKALGVDPQDTEENIRGGAAYLGRLHKHFKSWDKALASYDWGADNVQKAIDEWGPDWLEHTPHETQEYVQHILKKKSQVSP